MSNIGLFRSIVVFALLAQPLHAAVIETPHFTIEYAEGLNREYANMVHDTAERSFALISTNLGHEPDSIITITLTATKDEFRRLTQGRLPDWSSAVAVPGRRIILTPLDGLKMNLERIVAHELVHIFIHDASGNMTVPRWFHEGCAQAFSGEWNLKNRLYMAWRDLAGDLMTFDEIENVFSERGNDVTLAYDQSMLAVNYLMMHYGKDGPRKILDNIGYGMTFNESFQRVTGSSVNQFEKKYLAYAADTYGPGSFYTLIPGTWTLILVLAVIAFIVKSIRTRRKIKEWDREESGGIDSSQVVSEAEKIIKFRPGGK